MSDGTPPSFTYALALGAALALAGALPATAQQLTPDQITWLRGHRFDPSIAGGWARKAAAVRERRAALRRAGRLEGLSPAAAAREGAALTGDLRVPVLAVIYPDVAAPFPVESLRSSLFGAGGPGNVTFAGYFAEVSQGLLRPAGNVTEWLTLDSASTYYLRADEYRWPNRGRFFEFLSSVESRADPLVDFAQYDNDGPDNVPNSGDDDGVVDLLVILYATDCRGEWRNGFIWPGGGSLFYQTQDPAAGGGFVRWGPAVFLGAQNFGSCTPAPSGVLDHETGHALGLPDLYDYDFSSNGVGHWDLMGYGLYNSVVSPAYLGAWSREQLGWITVRDVAMDASTARLEPTELAHEALRFAVPSSLEYFLLENRQALGTDAFLPGPGLLIWHVDPTVFGVDDERHKQVDVEEADGSNDLDAARNFGDAKDPFPGQTANRRFGGYTIPDSRLYTGAQSGLLVDGITQNADGSVTVVLFPGPPAIVTQPLRAGRMGSPYADTLASSVGGSSVTWSVITGSLPPGVALDSANGVLRGIPEAIGAFAFTVEARRDLAVTRAAFTIEVTAPTLATEAVLDHLLGTATPLAEDELRYLDLLGNKNGRLDIGDFRAWLAASGSVSSQRLATRSRR